MTIQVNLNANEFKRDGSIKDGKIYNGKYDSLKILRFGNGRVYFMALNSEINGKVGTFAKQMQLVDGNVIISFGKNDKMIIGTYSDTEEINETPVNEVAEQTEVIQETIENNPITETKQPELKAINITETIIVRGYMGRVEEVEGKRITHDEFDLYLVKSSKYWSVYEKKTGKRVTNLQNTKKEAIDTLKDFLNNHSEKLKAAITATIEKDGHITDYKIGSWIRSA
jgi:hypothetical protein